MPTFDQNKEPADKIAAFEAEIEPILEQEVDVPDIAPLKSIDFGDYNCAANLLAALRRVKLYQ